MRAGGDGPSLRNPSPSILLSDRQEEPRILYLDSATDSCSTNLFLASPPSANTHARCNDMPAQPHPEFSRVDDAVEGDGNDRSPSRFFEYFTMTCTGYTHGTSAAEAPSPV